MTQEQVMNRATANGYGKEAAAKRIDELTAYALDNCGVRLPDAKRIALDWFDEELADFEFIA